QDLIAEANQVLKNSNDLLLTELGIALDDVTNPLSYGAKLVVALEQDRLDVPLFNPVRIHALKALEDWAGETVPLGVAAEIIRDAASDVTAGTYVGLANIRAHTGEYIPSTSSQPIKSVAWSFQAEDVLYGRLRPYLNKVWLADRSGSCSTELRVLRPRSHVIPDYLAVVLRSRVVLGQVAALGSGNTHPRLSDKDLRGVQIPLPSVTVQSSVSRTVMENGARAAELRRDAEERWLRARQAFAEALAKQR
ncbi:MAG: hypothetical protein M3198_01125, partial [Actinomycetota bacterium]|nr:hypothetical protein [Actinomycetota bacterium]